MLTLYCFLNSITVIMMFMKFVFAFVTNIVVGLDVGLDVAGATSIKVVSTGAAKPFDTTFEVLRVLPKPAKPFDTTFEI